MVNVGYLILCVLILVGGFILLSKGADAFVDGASSVAKRLRVSTMIIGMTVVAMGTSLPELAVSLSASVKGSNEMAYSNVIGSNIFNLMLICGLCAALVTLSIKKETLKREFPFSIAVAGLLLLLGAVDGEVGRLDGLIMLAVFAVFLWMQIRSALKGRLKTAVEAAPGTTDEAGAAPEQKVLSPVRSVVYIVAGAAAIILGGQLVVNSASYIAGFFGMSQTLIGLTIVAFGTSLPELMTSLAAAKKNDLDMALGNVIGSNVFNILMVLGFSAVASPVPVLDINTIDCIVLIAMSAIVLLFALGKLIINRWQGVVMVAMYGAYIVYTCIR